MDPVCIHRVSRWWHMARFGPHICPYPGHGIKLWFSFIPLTQESQWQGVATLAPVKPVRTILGDWPRTTDWGEAKEEPATVLGRDTAQKNPRVAPTAEEQESSRGTLRQDLPGPSWLGPTREWWSHSRAAFFCFCPETLTWTRLM